MTDINEKVDSLLDRILFYAMNERFRPELDRARSFFVLRGTEESVYSSELGFNEWLLHDYNFADGTSFISHFEDEEGTEEDRPLLEAMKLSRLSVLEVYDGVHGSFFKDLFTREDYAVVNTDVFQQLSEGALHLIRLYPMEGRWIAVPQAISFDRSYGTVLHKGMMDRYSEYCRANGPERLEDFVFDHPAFLYKLVEVVEDIDTQEDGDEDNYVVYQSTYLFPDYTAVMEALDDMPRTELAIAEDDVRIYRLYTTDGMEEQLAELVLSGGRLELECLTESDRTIAREITEAHLGKRVAYYKDEVLDMDDLLEGEA